MATTRQYDLWYEWIEESESTHSLDPLLEAIHETWATHSRECPHGHLVLPDNAILAAKMAADIVLSELFHQGLLSETQLQKSGYGTGMRGQRT